MPSFNYTDRRCRWLYFTGDSNVRNLLAIQHHAARRQLHEFRTALASPHHSEEGDGSVYQRGRQRTSGATCGTRWFDREYLYVTVHGVGHFPDASVIPPDSRLTLPLRHQRHLRLSRNASIRHVCGPSAGACTRVSFRFVRSSLRFGSGRRNGSGASIYDELVHGGGWSRLSCSAAVSLRHATPPWSTCDSESRCCRVWQSRASRCVPFPHSVVRPLRLPRVPDAVWLSHGLWTVGVCASPRRFAHEAALAGWLANRTRVLLVTNYPTSEERSARQAALEEDARCLRRAAKQLRLPLLDLHRRVARGELPRTANFHVNAERLAELAARWMPLAGLSGGVDLVDLV